MKEYIWNKKNLPHKGWMNIGVEDLEVPSHKCEMCGKEDIRYVHAVKHPLVEDVFLVGCKCAEELSNDYTTPKAQLKLAKKKTRWIENSWESEENFDYEFKKINRKTTQVGVYKVGSQYEYHVNLIPSNERYDTITQAKAKLYDEVMIG